MSTSEIWFRVPPISVQRYIVLMCKMYFLWKLIYLKYIPTLNLCLKKLSLQIIITGTYFINIISEKFQELSKVQHTHNFVRHFSATIFVFVILLCYFLKSIHFNKNIFNFYSSLKNLAKTFIFFFFYFIFHKRSFSFHIYIYKHTKQNFRRSLKIHERKLNSPRFCVFTYTTDLCEFAVSTEATMI